MFVDSAFRALCEGGIYASTHEPPCCARCGHESLSDSYASYVFFTARDDEHALHLHHAFTTNRKRRRALSILRRFCDVVWDGDPQKTIVVRPRSSWEPLRRWVRTRSIAVYWFARTSHLYAPGGVGRKRDREEFEAEMIGGVDQKDALT